MSRDQYQWFEQSDFRGGICEEPENAKPNQVLDARNVWCPEGRIQVRPGFEGAANWYATNINTWGSAAIVATIIREDIAGGVSTFTQTTDLSALAVGERWYASYTSKFNAIVDTGVAATNSNTSNVIMEYYNGTEWVYVPFIEKEILASGYIKLPYAHLSYGTSVIPFVAPGDWAETTITTDLGDVTGYAVRFTILDLALDASVTAPQRVITPLYNCSSVFGGVVQLSTHKRYFLINYGISPTSNYATIGTSTNINLTDHYFTTLSIGVFTSASIIIDRPCSYCSIPQFDTLYFSLNSSIYEYSNDCDHSASYNNNLPRLATIENRQEFIGTISGIKQLYHPDYVSWLPVFPQGKYLEFFHGQLWLANLNEEPYTVRWSAPQPAYRVWPSESYEILMEDDNSPITGIKAFGENLAVFKQDSIWRMIYNGTSATTGLNTYVPKKVPGGIGCVSNSSIVDINGILMFLAEDGVYAFDGSNKPEKVSGPIDKTVKKISPGMRTWTVACHWRKYNCYLLAVSLNGSIDNNYVLAYDYKNGSWWIWDGMAVRSWIVDEGEFDEQTIYFLTKEGYLNRLDPVWKHDHHTAITSYMKTQRIGYGAANTKLLREVRMSGENQDNTTITATIEREDEGSGTQVTGTMSFADSVENTLGHFTLGHSKLGATRRRERRLKFRKSGKWFTVKIAHSTNHKTWSMDKLSAGFIHQGIR